MESGVGGDVVAGAKDVDKQVQNQKLQKTNADIHDNVGVDAQIPGSSSGSGSDDPQLTKLDSKVVHVKQEKSGDELFAHLPEHERTILKSQLDIPEVKVSYRTLYRYATRWDLIILFLSALSSIISGALLPLMTVIFGQLSGQFTGLFLGTVDPSHFEHQVEKFTLYFVYLAIGEYAFTYISTLGFIYTGEHNAAKIREQYLAAILRQNIAYFDRLGSGEITTRITADTNLVQDGLSQKVCLTLTAVATFIAAFVIGFVTFWKLTLICSSTVVAIVLVMGSGSFFIVTYSKKSLQAYASGGTVVEEVFSSIRNAVAFGTQDRLARQYDEFLEVAQLFGTKQKTVLGFMFGSMMCIVFLNYGLAFWMGSRFVVDGETNLANVLTIILAVMIGAFSLGTVSPNVQAFTQAIAAGTKIFATIDRESPLDPTLDTGDKLEHVEGVIELKDIKHIYPSRPEVTVMDGVDLFIPAGKTTALVGASGSGKSTIVGLVERFYNPVGGQVTLDGHDIATLNLRWLRQQVALVQQEPVLFGETIYNNIKHGLIGSRFEHEPEEKQRERIYDAAKKANAHDFITSLPEGYNTDVGERGFLLSGGQKQRIAISRAIVSDPKILLLDEATSALDTKSEGVVQAALDAAAQGRTTIVIAHRLSTIKHAHNIVVMQQGRIVEQGTHNDLLDKQAAYFNLVQAQRIGGDQTEAEDGTETPEAMEEKLERSQSKTSDGLPSEDPEDEKLRLGRTNTSKSVSSMVLSKKQSGAKNQYSLLYLIGFIAKFNQKEMFLMIVGLIFSALSGGGHPTQGILFSKTIVSMSKPASQYSELRSEVNFWCLMYLMLGLVQLLTLAISHGIFSVCSERLIRRARDRAFRTLMRQDVSFFDKDENSTGALTSFLSTETTSLANISASTLGTILSSLTTLLACCIISLAIGWKLALVCISTLPVLLGCGFIRFWIIARFENTQKKNYEGSAAYACENTNAIRTVASLTRELDVWDNYHGLLVVQGRNSLISFAKSSHLYAASQSLILLCSALGFWYGGQLVGRGEYTLFQFFVCFTEVIFGAQSAGTVFSFAGDMGKARNAAAALAALFDHQPAIDTWSTDGRKIETVTGEIEFRDVHFRYPTRPEQPVLRGLNLTVRPGQYIALVGASGCGKSTTIALLERFYDPLAGSILVDNEDISALNLNDYRSHIALVSQEPTLYQGSIRDNILLGLANHADDVPDSLIEKACRDANIYDFIMSLPEGFSTIVGSKGSLLSGGQKQRIAIARALLRDPKILLLDEATSALDSESEKVVQAALDAAAKGRTTVAVAHRLSTIQKADVIYVFDKGRIVEKGTHSELMALKGRYRELVSLQSLERAH
ncbi:putative abc multidrug transporter mdr1 [Phaeomoniella chlamydospora]|uniref:Putative abc multidrug transporter mdr1 n=1 Tax=Phaeomoniella chlamydospora TaxID=158046 RepID=A0A0G2GMM3_PHACM|nr:putative abc multidrug transporter mdr1 [Phaeomoniella chlamydospora]